jgi:hypothetical protein
MSVLGILTYYFARKQVQLDREQLMEVFARQISQELLQELNDASVDLQAWATSGSLSLALTNSQHGRIDQN